MERETIKIKIPAISEGISHSEIVLNKDLTGEEMLTLGDFQNESTTIKAKKTIEAVVVSVDGNTDKEFISKTILSMRGKAFLDVMKEVNSVFNGIAEEGKK